MRKKGKKLREIRFYSQKAGEIIIVHTEQELRYAKILEDDINVASYTFGKSIDRVKLGVISKVDIRGQYFKEEWLTDFYIVARDGSVLIREMVRENDLDKLAEVEKLELSRRYWTFCGVRDWKMVLG